MPANSVALITLPAPNMPSTATWDEQASNFANGNKFDADGFTMIYVRNTTASAVNVSFLADIYGAERILFTSPIPANTVENGVKIFGPFSGIFFDHSTTASGDAGRVFVQQGAGTPGDLVFCPFRVNTSLA